MNRIPLAGAAVALHSNVAASRTCHHFFAFGFQLGVEPTGPSDLTSTLQSAPDFRFTYSRPELPWAKRALIRSIERVTGQPLLEAMYRTWSGNPVKNENIFAAAMRLMRVSIDTNEDAWANVPRTGPLLVVANHPYGVIDGLAIGHLLTKIRPDVRIMTHSLLCQPKEVQQYMLPVDFGGGAEAQRTSLTTRRLAIDWLKQGHVVVVFPAGGVATRQNPFKGHAVDLAWHPFAGKLARQKNINILPVFFSGQNSMLFHIASHTFFPLRIALMFRESVRMIGGNLRVTAGQCVNSDDLNHSEGRDQVLKQLRAMTYELAGENGPDASAEYKWPRYVGVA